MCDHEITIILIILKEQWRPIHYACKIGFVDILKYLLSANCDIEAENDVRYARSRNHNYFDYIEGTVETDSFCL